MPSADERLRRLLIPAGLVFGVVFVWGLRGLAYLDWYAIVPPVDEVPLIMRADTKGDGQFGAPRSGQRRHRGVDLAAPVGSPVRAILSGTVRRAQTHRGRGRYIELDHRDDLQSIYAHLGTCTVREGDRVRQGQVIGTVGKTGNARHPSIGAHLHLEILRAGRVIDPESLGLNFLESGAQTSNATADAQS